MTNRKKFNFNIFELSFIKILKKKNSLKFLKLFTKL